MEEDIPQSPIHYCDDSELSYQSYRTEFVEGHGLLFDDSYRLAHLPLVAPQHPLVIPSKPGSSYQMGVHDVVYSIAMPIPIDDLTASENFKSLLRDLQSADFSHKFSWDTFEQRKTKLHATVCGALSTGQAPAISQHIYAQLKAIGPVAISVRGVFSGNHNVGRLYLKVYPECRGGKNMCHEIQCIVGAPVTQLYVVGLLNFVDELNSQEAHALSRLLDAWWDKELIHLQLDKLWLLKSRDDLVLDGGIEQAIPLVF